MVLRKYFVHVSSSEKFLCSYHISTFVAFLYFQGDFWVYLGINSFSQRISELKFMKIDILKI